ncbi:MAG: flagellum-specific ATP synthase FliI, partial [Bryobacteraceae bacterium]
MASILSPCLAALAGLESMRQMGEVVEMAGLLVESTGPAVAIGDFCEIVTATGRRVRSQVIGFRDGRVLSMPLEETGGVELGSPVVARPDAARVAVSPGL